MEIDNESSSLWTRLKCTIFMKLGANLWQYTLIHKDYWNRPYGISFTQRRDFPKLFKYDMVDMNDDLEVEANKKS